MAYKLGLYFFYAILILLIAVLLGASPYPSKGR